MPGQVQCPNCGGYRVEVANQLVRAHETPLSGGRKLFHFIVLQAFVALCVWLAFQPEYGFEGTERTMGLVALGILDVRVTMSILEETRTHESTTGYRYRCQLCGYLWEWQIGAPLPIARVRPDLIQAGSVQLAAEEAARAAEARKEAEYEQQAAAWWAEQQRRVRK